MTRSKLRRQIAWEAARLIYQDRETDYYVAKMKSARRLSRGWVRPADLPTNIEIRDQVLMLARLHEGDHDQDRLRDMRVHALQWMMRLERFQPRLIGSALTGPVRQDSAIDLHLFADRLDAVTAELDFQGVSYSVEVKPIRTGQSTSVSQVVRIKDQFVCNLKVFKQKLASHVFRSSITKAPMERASAAELRQLLQHEYPDLSLDLVEGDQQYSVDRFQLYLSLLAPLESASQDPQQHPEGDALYHSLQVFELAKNLVAYDEELLLAALLHDVGKAIDPINPAQAAVDALQDQITPRTAWLILNLPLGHRLRQGTLGHRASQRLREQEDFDDLMLLVRCDRDGRKPGAAAPSIEQALDYIRNLSETFG